MGLLEIGYKCGCSVAIYKKSVLVKICEEHYPKYRTWTVAAILEVALHQLPDWAPKPDESETAWTKDSSTKKPS